MRDEELRRLLRSLAEPVADGVEPPEPRLVRERGRRRRRRLLAGGAFVQNVRRGHYELAVEEPGCRRVAVAFDELALAI